MPTDVDRQLERTNALLDRTRPRYFDMSKRTRRAREGEIVGRLTRIAAADAVIIVVAMVIGIALPNGLGMNGAMLVMLLLALTTLFFAVFPRGYAPSTEALAETPLKALPLQTERWLEAQRPALPAPMQSLVDSIGVKLEIMTPQLARLDEREPAAAEIRKLIGEQLPELVNGYGRVPTPLRNVERNGLTPDQQLAQGLQTIDDEIAEMTEQLARGDLDALATRGRYLQIRYAEDS